MGSSSNLAQLITTWHHLVHLDKTWPVLAWGNTSSPLGLQTWLETGILTGKWAVKLSFYNWYWALDVGGLLDEMWWCGRFPIFSWLSHCPTQLKKHLNSPQIWNINLETIISIAYHSKPLSLILGTSMYYNWIGYDSDKPVKCLNNYINCDGNNAWHCF